MKKLKLTDLNKNERLNKEALCCIRGGSFDIPCCCTGSTRQWRRTGGAVNEELKYEALNL